MSTGGELMVHEICLEKEAQSQDEEFLGKYKYDELHNDFKNAQWFLYKSFHVYRVERINCYTLFRQLPEQHLMGVWLNIHPFYPSNDRRA